jgi:hypothetical protein
LADVAVGISEEEGDEDSSTAASEEMKDADPAAAVATAGRGSVQAAGTPRTYQQQQTPLPSSSSIPAGASDTSSSSKQQQQLRWQDQALGLLSSPSLPVAGRLLGPANLPGVVRDEAWGIKLVEYGNAGACIAVLSSSSNVAC